jgi:two-component system, chemotaxis family, chemotaxis protein CheY
MFMSNKKEYLEIIKQFTFLVVDDWSPMRRLICNMLSTVLGIQNKVECAEDGKEAVNKLQHMHCDFIICDINMPRMNGIEFLNFVRETEEYKDIPFLMITGESTQAIVALVAEGEVNDYLVKPIEILTLEERLVEIFQRKRHPSEGEQKYRQALAHQQVGEYDLAINGALELCAPPYIKQAKVLNLLGECHLAAGKLPEARQLVAQAINLNPFYIKSFKSLAAIKEKAGDLKGAIEALGEANKLSPFNSTRLLEIGRLLLKVGVKQEALKVINNALQLITISPKQQQKIKKEAGDILLQGGMAAEAADFFIQCIKDDPRNVHLYNRAGVALRQQKKYQEAFQWYQKALEIDRRDETTYYNLGILYYDIGQKEKSLKSFKTALHLKPDFSKAQKKLQQLFKAL